VRDDLVVIELVAGEFGFPLEFTLTDADNTVVTLAGDETITLAVKKEGGTAVSVGTGSIYSAVGGVVRITLATGDVVKLPAGKYVAMVTASTASKVLRSLPFWLVVKEAVSV
jgi:hypothetical protein